MNDRPALVVIGASARFFAASARDAGWRVYAADLFGDLDLRVAAAASVCVRDRPGGYPGGLTAAVRPFPGAAFSYVGGIENHPEIIRELARKRPLLGSPPAAVARIRDPWSLQQIVREAGLRAPDCRRDPGGLPLDGSFLRKPLGGAGGRGIVPWDDAAPPAAAPSFWQQRIAGAAWSAAYLIAADGGRIIGASRQLTGEPWCHAKPFAYCGSVDVPPHDLPAALRHRLAALAPQLAACGLRGAVGVDLVIDTDDDAWVIEVNPRPTASMELIERAHGLSIAAAHVAACGGPACPSPGRPLPAADGRHAKAVLFAPAPLHVDEAWVAGLTALGLRWGPAATAPSIADVPPPGRDIPAGGPICTLFASAATAAEAVAMLRRRVAAVAATVSPPGDAAGRPTATRGRTP